MSQRARGTREDGSSRTPHSSATSRTAATRAAASDDPRSANRAAAPRSTASALNRALRRASDLSARYGGEEVVIVLPEADLAAHCATRLARYKCPRAFFPVAELPRGANGKLNRRRLTAPGV